MTFVAHASGNSLRLIHPDVRRTLCSWISNDIRVRIRPCAWKDGSLALQKVRSLINKQSFTLWIKKWNMYIPLRLYLKKKTWNGGGRKTSHIKHEIKGKRFTYCFMQNGILIRTCLLNLERRRLRFIHLPIFIKSFICTCIWCCNFWI